MNELKNNPQLLDALTALKRTRDQLSELKSKLTEPIAIIGMSCRFPGGANSVEDYWHILNDGRDVVSEVPQQRWSIEDYYHGDPGVTGKMYSRHGGFLNIPIDEFDASAFKISPREAELMDPQQRLILQVAWEALEQAQIDKNSLRGSQTGVFVGLSSYDYSANILKLADAVNIDTYFGTGNAGSVAAGRLSYLLGLQGPCLTVDTACSSSLVAVNLACQSLHLNESELAIVGGVNLMLLPETTVYFCKAKMLSPVGRCKTFDANADGYVRGEGCGVVILKRLSDARRDNNHILAVIRGTAVNQDGASGGLTVPNGKAQENVIRQALKNANLQPHDIDYIEAHGTGTSLGDPIEYHALASVFSQNRDVGKPLYLGSVKTNIGHLEAAAGMAGLIKTVLALQHEKLPAHLHFNQPNPHINLEVIPALIPTQTHAWQKNDARLRRAGISSFAFSGTNAHVILEEGEKYTWEKTEKPKKKTDKQKYWFKQTTKKMVALPSQQQLSTQFFSAHFQTPQAENYFQTIISLDHPTYAYLKDHQLLNKVIFPGAAYVEWMLQAGREIIGEVAFSLIDVRFLSALELEQKSSILLQVRVVPKENKDNFDISIHSFRKVNAKEIWICHAQAEIKRLNYSEASAQKIHVEAVEQKDFSPHKIYEHFHQVGFNYEKSFQTITSIWHQNDETFATITSNESIEGALSDPRILDGCFQTLGHVLFEKLNNLHNEIYLPIAIKSFTLYQALGKKINVKITVQKDILSTIIAHFDLLDEHGTILATIEGFAAKRVHHSALLNLMAKDHKLDDLLYEMTWRKLPISSKDQHHNTQQKSWVLFAAPSQNELKNALLQSQTTLNHLDLATLKEQLHADIKEIIYVADDSSDAINQCKQLLELMQTLISLSENKIKLYIVTKGAQSVKGEVAVNFAQTTLWGMCKVFNLEQTKINCIYIDLDAQLSTQQNAVSLLQELDSSDEEDQVVLRSDGRFVPRLISAKVTQESELLLPDEGCYQLCAGDSGLIQDLTFKPVAERELNADEIELEVKATALNFRDTLTVMRLYPGNPPLGVDCAGIITRVGSGVKEFNVGDAVFGMVSGCFGNRVITPAVSVSHKPERLSFSEAATLPIVFLTAYYAFHHVMQIKPGSRVLIHTASGGLGLAAIQLAKLVGAEIFVTAGSPEKRDYLRGLGIEHVFDSRNLDYGKLILDVTKGAGVDVVLNTLTGKDYVATTLSACGKDAHFLEVSKRDIWTQEEMAKVRPDIHYAIIALDTLAVENPQFIQQMYKEIFPLFANQALNPIPFRTYSYRQAIDAFQEMRQAKHIGKLVLLPEPSVKTWKKEGIHLITGGLGALGFTVTEWLLKQGAREILLLNRREPSEENKAKIAALQQQYADAKITTRAVDIADRAQVEKLFKALGEEKLSVRGVMHAAGVLDDGMIVNQSVEKYARVFAPKVSGAWHLHECTKSLNLDYFVMFSSIAALQGSPGQSNYAAANAYLDALAHYRRTHGCPAQSINWGPWHKMGMASNFALSEQFGIGSIQIEEGLAALHAIVSKGSYTQVGVLPIQWEKYLSWVRNDKFLSEIKQKNQLHASKQKPNISLKEMLSNSQPEEFEAIIKNRLKQHVKNVLKFESEERIKDETLLSDLGIDSLMALEFGNLVQKDLGDTHDLSRLFTFDQTSVQTIYDQIIVLLKIPKAEKKIVKLTEDDLQEIQTRVNKIVSPNFWGRILQNWIRPILHFLCRKYFKIEINGAENLPTNEPFILCANHVSSIDGIALLLAGKNYKNGFVTLIADNHFFQTENLIALFGDAVPFDRSLSEYAWLKNSTYINFFKEKNKSFILFPEGTRSTTGDMQEFKHGVTWFAHKENLKVVPAYIDGAYEILPRGKMFPKPKKLTITIGKPLSLLNEKPQAEIEFNNTAEYQNFTKKLRETIVALAAGSK